MNCKGCHEDKKLVRAHVIPNSFFRPLQGIKEPAKIATNRPDRYTKRAPKGIYDQTILCEDCERRFAAIDDYGHEVLIRNAGDRETLRKGKETVGWLIHGIDSRRLKLFLISVLWRASVSNLEFFGNIQLGPHEKQAKGLIWNFDPGDKDAFAPVLARFKEEPLGPLMFNPTTERFSHVNFCRFYLLSYVVSIKVDSRPTPPIFRDFVLGREGPQILFAREFEGAPELRVLKSVQARLRDIDRRTGN